ncbi:MAG: carboxypeptidase-like regulatory domain-containing protein [Bacteroidales bacterium]|nr:carboxypeptidase-like regulatory domain-containing protein [Bacteroidales bacterium]
MNIKKYCQIIFLIIAIMLCVSAMSQNTVVNGIVRDGKTGEVMPYVNVTTNTKSSVFIGTITDENGKFSLKASQSFDTVFFQFVGYKSVAKKIKPHASQNLTIELTPEIIMLDEAVITAKKEKYRRKNNPAVILMENVQSHKDSNNITYQDYYQYRKHEKSEISILGVNDSLRYKKGFKKLGFLFDNVQISEISGKKYMPVYFMEKLYEEHYRKKPSCAKTMLIGQKDVTISKFIETQTIDFMLQDVLGDVNVYDNSIRILSNDLISPLAPFATRFYQFFLTDTIEYKGDSCIVLAFNPANLRDIGFSGKLWVTKDSSYAVKKIYLEFPKKSSVNFVENLSINQEYTRIGNQLCLTENKTIMEGSVYGASVHGKRQTFYDGYEFGKNMGEKFYNNNDVTQRVEGFNKRTNAWWEENRISPLTTGEQNTYNIPNEFNSITTYKVLLNTMMAFVSGYIDCGKFDYGPLENTLSWNNVEGVRLRVGGKTNVKFNKNIFLNGFVAYGTKDKTIKYNAEVMYNFADKLYHQWEFPVNLLTLGVEKNTEIPGQSLLMGTYDRFTLSFNRGDIDMMTLNTRYYAEYWYETMSQLSTKIRVERKEIAPLANLLGTFHSLSTDAAGNYIVNYDKDNPLTTATFNMELRYAKNEQFFQSQKYRMTMNSTTPIYTLSYTYGANIFGADYEFHKIKAEVQKRWFILNFGFADISIQTGKVFGKAAYPLLFVHQANQNWAYQDESFNLMNYFEFVSDYYAQGILNYNFNGFIFNRIPLIRALKLREVFAVKAIWGGLSDKNTPATDNDLIDFAKNSKGEYKTYHLEEKPYVEANVGIDNIFKVMRIDYVRRFTYLENPNISKWGIRFRFRFTF